MNIVDAKQQRRKLKMVSKTCYAANILYLFVHIFYLILFIVAKLTVLIYVDAAIILLYLLFFLIIKNGKYYIYALCCGNLFFGFIAVTTIMLGFNVGFPFYLIGLCIVSFFTTYFSKSRNIKGSIIWACLSAVIYLTLYLITEFNKPYYVVDKWLEITLFIFHSIVVFLFIAGYMVIFIKYAIGLEKKIMNQSRTDELTQIANRYALYDYFESETNKSNLLLALFDIDDFKNINDTYGHVVGDYILKHVAEITSQVLNDGFICRYGGEEFVVVLSENETASFFERLEYLRKSIEQEVFKFESLEIHITITIGAIKYSNDFTLEKWVELADKNMYAGKKTGKNRIII